MSYNIYEYAGPIFKEEINPKEYCENTIDQQIVNGAKLRKVKNKTNPALKEYRVVDINNGESQYRNLTNSHEKSKIKKKDKRKKPKLIVRKEKNECPLRIAKLALPSKRHCLDTWKNRGQTLPIIMVDRLRGIVLDEKPLVQVSDAIGCFKRRKRKSRNTIEKNKEIKKRDKLKLLCGVFAYKITKILEKPILIELNPSLTKISRVIDEDISDILCNAKNKDPSKNIYKIHKDIINKVTVWVASVLEESSFKILLDDLQDLEEEEGPVWHFLDLVIDKVVVTCEQKRDAEGRDSGDNSEIFVDYAASIESSEQLSNYEEAQDLDDNQILEKNAENNILENKELYEDIISNLIENVISDKSAGIDNPYDNTDGEDDNNTDAYLSGTNSITDLKTIDVDYLKDYINNILSEIIHDAYKHGLEEIYEESRNQIEDDADEDNYKINTTGNIQYTTNIDELDNNNIDLSKNTIDDNTYESLNVNEEVTTSTDTPDDSQKKVKFSNKNIDGNIEIYNFAASKFQIGNDSTIYETKSVPIQNNTTKTFVVKSPSPYLLSDADESWPDVLLPMTKSSASVSKSVLSLGQLNETEEELSSGQSFSDNNNPYTEERSSEIQKPVVDNISHSDSFERNNNENINGDVALEQHEELFQTKSSNTDISVIETYNKDSENNNDDNGQKEKKLNALQIATRNKDITVTESYIKDSENNKDDNGGREKKLNALQIATRNKDIADTETYNKDSENNNDDNGERENKLNALQIATNNKNIAVTESYNKDSENNNDDNGEREKKLSALQIATRNKDIAVTETYNKDSKNNNDDNGEREKKLNALQIVTNNKDIAVTETYNKDSENNNDDNCERKKKLNALQIVTNNIDTIFIKKSNQKPYSMTLRHFPYINMQENYKEDKQEIGKKQTQTQHTTPKILNKCLQTEIINAPKRKQSILNQDLLVSNEKVYREWCNNLENVVDNLDIWLNWIQNVTAEIERLRKKGPNEDAPWLKLRNNVDVDTQLWIHLSPQLHRGLRGYRQNYDKVMPYKCFCNKKHK